MRFLTTFIFLSCFAFANDLATLQEEAESKNTTAAYELAKYYEEVGNVTEALKWYKFSATLSMQNAQKMQDDISLNEIKTREELEEKLIDTQNLPAIKETAKSIKKDEEFFRSYIDEYDDNETQNTVFQILSSTFGLLPYHSNYLLPATYDFKSHSDGRKHMETVFQLSLRKDLLTDFFGFNERFGFAYTQRSWWQITEDSSPFRETNYLPEMYIMLPTQSQRSVYKGLQFGFLHESNGRGELDSRSWNRLYLEGYFQYKGLFIVPRVWYRFNESAKNDDNPKITKYIGHGDLNLIYPYKEHVFKLMLRNNFKSDENKGAVQLDWTFPLWENGLFGYIQYFNGYGESLVDFNKRTNRIGLGFAFTR
ncbi:MAG: phospholipase A [Campylobacteraceae bacterium]